MNGLFLGLLFSIALLQSQVNGEDDDGQTACNEICAKEEPLIRPIFLPSKFCSQFCGCNSGLSIVFKCSPGLEFNPKLNGCDLTSRTECQIIPPETSTTPSILDPEPKTDPPSQDNCLGSCPKIDPLDRSIYLPSKNCSQFCECSNGVPIVLPCPRGLEFNPKLNVCDWPNSAGCTGQVDPTDSPPGTTPDATDDPTSDPGQPTTQPPNTLPPPTPSNKNCLGSCPKKDPLDRSIYLPSKNCSEFCECSNGLPIVLPCPRGLEFNPKLNVCDWPNSAGCTGHVDPTDSPPGTTPGATDDPTSDPGQPTTQPPNT